MLYAAQRQYFSDCNQELAVRNREIVRTLSYAIIIIIALYYLIATIFFSKWVISPAYGLVIPVLLPILWYAKKRTLSVRASFVLTNVMYAVVMIEIILLSVFPYPDVPSVYYPLFLIAAPVIFILPIYNHLIALLLSYISFCSLVLMVKSPSCLPHELIEATTAAIFFLVITGIIAQLRLQERTVRNRYVAMSKQDGLTGLLNKSAGMDAAKLYIDFIKNEESFAVLFLDIDNFKSINDVKGHIDGDKCIESFGKLILDTCRKGDIVCRFGGDEFMIILKDISNEGVAVSMAERILAGVREMAVYKENGVTCSIGISFCSSTTCCDLEEALRRADQALYLAKDEGKDRLQLYGMAS